MAYFIERSYYEIGILFHTRGASLEEAFGSITEASFDMPYRTIENKKESVLGVLVA